ncbi:hypothetical protein DAI22_09g100000 [Oryza sativa Japonica Group]|nr:hypothetical protein DAI22_09g100000 [Oryza sativa Japonica Group]
MNDTYKSSGGLSLQKFLEDMTIGTILHRANISVDTSSKKFLLI